MAVSREQVEKVAALARLRLEPAEAEQLAHDLGEILDHVAQLGELDPAAPASAPEAPPPLRPDRIEPGLTRDEALYNAPAAKDGFFTVPRLLGER